MSSSIKNLYQFRTTSQITQAQAAASTFTVGNDIFTNTAVSITAGSIQLTNRTGSIVELFTVTVAAGVATIATRGIKPDGTTDAIYQYERPKNTLCTLTVLENQIFDKGGSETLTGNITYTGEVTYNGEVYFPSLTTAERDAITWNRDGAIIYNETTGTTQQRVGGSWSDIDTGTVTPNASGTVAGKVEIATQAEFDAGTATGGTGAQLTPTNDQIRKQISTATAKTTPVNADSIAISDSAASGVIKKTTLTEFKAASDMQATTTTSGFVELATDAEAATGTDETRYINPKQLLASKTYNQTLTKVNASINNGTSNTTSINLSSKGGFITAYGFVTNTAGSNRTMYSRLQISDNGSSWSTLTDLLNVTVSGTSAQPDFIRSFSYIVSKGKYIRGEVYGSGTNSGAYIEIAYQELT